MGRDQILEELKALHRGRGIRRPGVRSWLGPYLLDALGAAPDAGDGPLRSQLATLLGRHAEPLPPDLRWLFRLASGLAADHPTLDERLAIAEREFDRSDRVVRRKLREAEQLVAESFLAGAAAAPGADPGWTWLGKAADVVLGEDAVITVTRTVKALADHQIHIHDTVMVPWLRPDEELEAQGVDGFDLIGVERIGVGSFRLSYALAQELRRGDELSTTLRMRVPRARALSPFFVLWNKVSATSIRVSVDFGEPRVASSVWVIDGLEHTVERALRPPQPQEAPPLVERRVSREFVAPKPEHAYGFGWVWADQAPTT